MNSEARATEIANSLAPLAECCVRHCTKRFRLDEDARDELLSLVWLGLHKRAKEGKIDEACSVRQVLSLTLWTSFTVMKKQRRTIDLEEAAHIRDTRQEFRDKTGRILQQIDEIVGGTSRAQDVIRLWMRGLSGLQTARSLNVDKSIVYRLREALRLQIGEALDTSKEA